MGYITNLKVRYLLICFFLYLLSFLLFVALLAAMLQPARAAVPEIGTDQTVDDNQARWIERPSLFTIQASASVTIYMPVVIKNPTPPPFLYQDDFSNAASGWPKISTSSCVSNYINGRYKMEIRKTSQECWSGGPAKTLVKYGLFEVKAYGEGNGNFSYGLYINGKGGGEQYLYVVQPSDSSCSSGKGRYKLFRTTNNVPVEKLKGCHSAVKRGTGSGAENLLGIKHTNDGTISIYANGQLLDTYKDGNQLKGEGTGLYGLSGSALVTIRNDDFIIKQP